MGALRQCSHYRQDPGWSKLRNQRNLFRPTASSPAAIPDVLRRSPSNHGHRRTPPKALQLPQSTPVERSDTHYSGTVHFGSTDPQAVLPGKYTFNSTDSGTHTFTVTLETASIPFIDRSRHGNAEYPRHYIQYHSQPCIERPQFLLPDPRLRACRITSPSLPLTNMATLSPAMPAWSISPAVIPLHPCQRTTPSLPLMPEYIRFSATPQHPWYPVDHCNRFDHSLAHGEYQCDRDSSRASAMSIKQDTTSKGNWIGNVWLARLQRHRQLSELSQLRNRHSDRRDKLYVCCKHDGPAGSEMRSGVGRTAACCAPRPSLP